MLRRIVAGKLGRCGRCIRWSAWGTVAGWIAVAGTRAPLALTVAAAFTGLLGAHVVVFAARAVRRERAHDPLSAELTRRRFLANAVLAGLSLAALGRVPVALASPPCRPRRVEMPFQGFGVFEQDALDDLVRSAGEHCRDSVCGPQGGCPPGTRCRSRLPKLERDLRDLECHDIPNGVECNATLIRCRCRCYA